MKTRIVCAAVCLVAVRSWGESYGFGNKALPDAPACEKLPAGVPLAPPFTPKFRWFQNRVADFCDIFHFGIGATHENPITGTVSPSFGAHVQVTDFGHLGYVCFGGVSAEMEGRGFGAYMERREIWGLGAMKGWSVTQEPGAASFYKDPEASRKWALRMDTQENFEGESAHILIHADGGPNPSPWKEHPRGWHNYAYTGAEVAIPLGIPKTPLNTHLGLTVRIGVDTSQVADFVLGLFGLDFWHDDLREADLN